MTSAEEFYAILHRRNPDLAYELPRIGGLRGMFDTASAEWGQTTPQQKLAVLDSLLRTGFTVERFLDPFIETMQRHGYHEDSARREFTSGVSQLLQFAVTRRSIVERIGDLDTR